MPGMVANDERARARFLSLDGSTDRNYARCVPAGAEDWFGTCRRWNLPKLLALCRWVDSAGRSRGKADLAEVSPFGYMLSLLGDNCEFGSWVGRPTACN